MPTTAKITAGEVEFVFFPDDDERREVRILKPSLKALTQLNRIYSGIAKVRDALVAQDVDAVCNVLRLGLNLPDKEVKALPQKVFENGITFDTLVPLIKYVQILANGGKPLPNEEDPEAAPEGEGSTEGND